MNTRSKRVPEGRVTKSKKSSVVQIKLPRTAKKIPELLEIIQDVSIVAKKTRSRKAMDEQAGMNSAIGKTAKAGKKAVTKISPEKVPSPARKLPKKARAKGKNAVEVKGEKKPVTASTKENIKKVPEILEATQDVSIVAKRTRSRKVLDEDATKVTTRPRKKEVLSKIDENVKAAPKTRNKVSEVESNDAPKAKATKKVQRKRLAEKPAELQEELSVTDEGDKENVEESPKSAEKKPIYKIVDAKPSNVPMEQLIVTEEPEAGPSEDVYMFEMSQGDEKKKVKKRKSPKVKKERKQQKPKMWDNKEFQKGRLKENAAQRKAAKLRAIPAHIVAKVKEKQLLKHATAQSSTPLKESNQKDMNLNEMSPIVQHEIDLSEDDTFEEVIGQDVVVPQDDPPEAEETNEIVPQPWRSDESLQLPTTSHIKHSGRDFLPTYSSDMILKATPRKPKMRAKVPQVSIAPTDATFNVPGDKSEEYNVDNCFGFETDDPLEVNTEIVAKHGEEALQKERERARALAPPKQSRRVIPPRQKKQTTISQDPQPSTSKAAAATEVPQDLFVSQDTEALRRSYSRPHKHFESDDESDEEPVVKQGKPTKKGGDVQKYKKTTTTKTSKKDQKQLEELEEFCTSFNEMCAEVEKGGIIIEKSN